MKALLHPTFVIVFVGLTTMVSKTQAQQMRKWMINKTQIDFTNGTPQATQLEEGLSAPYSCSAL